MSDPLQTIENVIRSIVSVFERNEKVIDEIMNGFARFLASIDGLLKFQDFDMAGSPCVVFSAVAELFDTDVRAKIDGYHVEIEAPRRISVLLSRDRVPRIVRGYSKLSCRLSRLASPFAVLSLARTEASTSLDHGRTMVAIRCAYEVFTTGIDCVFSIFKRSDHSESEDFASLIVKHRNIRVVKNLFDIRYEGNNIESAADNFLDAIEEVAEDLGLETVITPAIVADVVSRWPDRVSAIIGNLRDIVDYVESKVREAHAVAKKIASLAAYLP